MENKIVTLEKNKTIKIEKEQKQRVIVNTNENWTNCIENQYEILHEKKGLDYSNILMEVKKKISGYKSQDKTKEKYDARQFVDLDFTMNLLEKSEYKCYYCKDDVLVVYSYVRDPKQWSLERLDNSYGHNKNNVVLACLSCNLHRRTMYHERYAFTKQLDIIKMN